MAPRTQRTRDNDHSISQARPARDKHKHAVAKQPQALRNRSRSSKSSNNGTRATLDSNNARKPAVAVLLLLRIARAHAVARIIAALLCVVAVAARSGNNNIFAAENTKIRVGFQAPGWLSGSGTPSPKSLAGSHDFDHVRHGSRSSAGDNACTVLSTSPPWAPRSGKHEERPAAKQEK